MWIETTHDSWINRDHVVSVSIRGEGDDWFLLLICDNNMTATTPPVKTLGEAEMQLAEITAG